MIQIKYNLSDLRYLFLLGDHSDIKKVEKYFNQIPQYQLLPTFPGIPQPEIYLDKFLSKGQYIHFIATGLWRNLQIFCERAGIKLEGLDPTLFRSDDEITKEQFMETVKDFNKSFELRDYQLEACWKIIKYKMSLSELCTRSGKTAMMACILQYLMTRRGIKKPLIIVPSIHLVKQGVSDFAEYTDFFNVGQVWAESDIVGYENCIIGTFQSLVLRVDKRSKHYNPKYFDGVDCVVIDEVHRANCKSIKNILASEFMKNVKYKFGFTGTLPKENTLDIFGLQSLLGPKIQEISSRELIEEGFLADPIIKQYRIQYEPSSIQQIQSSCAEYLLSTYVKDEKGKQQMLPMEQRRMTMVHEKRLPTALSIAKQRLDPTEYNMYLVDACSKSSKTLILEQMMAMFSQPKIDIMDKLITQMDKNVIVFAHNTEYIKYLEQHFSQKFPDRIVKKVSGATNLKKRQQAIDTMLVNNNCIIVASFGVFGTGLTIRNVDYGIFAQSFKADTITRQSLGRLMLRTAEKSEFYMYDMIDVFPTKKLRSQGATKINIYKKEGHRNEVIDIKAPFSQIDLDAL